MKKYNRDGQYNATPASTVMDNTSRLTLKGLDAAKSRFCYIQKSIMNLTETMPDVRHVALSLIKVLQRPHRDGRLEFAKDKAVSLYQDDLVQDTLFHALQYKALEEAYKETRAVWDSMTDEERQDGDEPESPFLQLVIFYYRHLRNTYFFKEETISVDEFEGEDGENINPFEEIEDTRAEQELKYSERERIYVSYNGESAVLFKDDYEEQLAFLSRMVGKNKARGVTVYTASERQARDYQRKRNYKTGKLNYKAQKMLGFIETIRIEGIKPKDESQN